MQKALEYKDLTNRSKHIRCTIPKICDNRKNPCTALVFVKKKKNLDKRKKFIGVLVGLFCICFHGNRWWTNRVCKCLGIRRCLRALTLF